MQLQLNEDERLNALSFVYWNLNFLLNSAQRSECQCEQSGSSGDGVHVTRLHSLPLCRVSQLQILEHSQTSAVQSGHRACAARLQVTTIDTCYPRADSPLVEHTELLHRIDVVTFCLFLNIKKQNKILIIINRWGFNNFTLASRVADGVLDLLVIGFNNPPNSLWGENQSGIGFLWWLK